MSLKKLLFYLFLSLTVGTLVVLLLNQVAKSKMEQLLSENSLPGKLTYEALKTQVLFGNMELQHLSYHSPELSADFNKIHVEGLHYFQLLFNNKVELDKVLLKAFALTFHKTSADTLKGKSQKEPPNILIHNFEVSEGNFLFLNKNADSIFSVRSYSMKLDSLVFNEETQSNKIPIFYKNHQLKAKNIFYYLNEFQFFSLEKLVVSKNEISAEMLRVVPKFTPTEMSQRLQIERDRYDLKIQSITSKNPNFDFGSSPPFFASSLVQIHDVNLEIYRDKTLPDDTSIKKMYSSLLRELNLKLTIDSLKLTQAFIKYQERLQPGRALGTIAFYDLSAEIQNLVNHHLNRENFPQTQIEVRARLMDTSELHVKWNFYVNNLTDRFSISGKVLKIPPAAMNPFFVPAMHIRAKGDIDALYFNFEGNKVQALGDMRIDYNNFKVEVLKKNGKEKNKFLSSIANLFIKKNPKNKSVVKTDIEVVRDQTKSFWNYFWSCIKKGLLKSMI